MIIAIDGPAASGKGTLGKRLAAHYGLRHLDTGLLYRAVAKAVVDAGHRPDDAPRAVEAAKALDPAAFDEAALKGPAVGEAASVVSAIGEVRAALFDLQRSFAAAALPCPAPSLPPHHNTLPLAPPRRRPAPPPPPPPRHHTKSEKKDPPPPPAPRGGGGGRRGRPPPPRAPPPLPFYNVLFFFFF